MSIYFELFLTFLKIGAFSFGGGYGMIALIKDTCLANGWLTEDGLMNFIAVSESTPGPIAVNIATFVGASQGGAMGALCATTGVVLPSFIVIFIIAAFINNLTKYRPVKSVLGGIKPVLIGLIGATGITMLLNVIFGFVKVGGNLNFDCKSAVIMAVIVAIGLIYKRIKAKEFSPILMILISAILGIVLFSF